MAPPKGSIPWNKGRYKERTELTAELLRTLVHYEPETGQFTRVKNGRIMNHVVRKGYIRVRVAGKKYMAHRLAWLYMTGKWPRDQIDHINRHCSDNRFSNLREATALENCQNRQLPSKRGCKPILSDAERLRRAEQMRINRLAYNQRLNPERTL